MILRCIVPRELAAELADSLREYWRDEPSITVLVERRGRRDRRRGERRREEVAGPPGEERRRIRGRAGLRVAERRTTALNVTPPKLPPCAMRHADQLVFVEFVESTGRDAEDAEANRLLIRAQSGDTDAFGLLYQRYFDRVYAYARVALRDPHEAEDVAQQVFANVIQALPRYELRRDSPFRSWLFRITRNAVLRALARNGRFHVEEPTELDRRMESPTPEELSGLDWLSDHHLALLVERLPLAQRQVILLRYVFEFPTEEIAAALGRSPLAIRMLEHRAMRALEARLASCRTKPKPARSTHSPMLARVRSLPVTSSRRIALEPISRALGWQHLRPAAYWRR
jgi:RNA polymerase sigma-70 factor (ECF subfamily)